MAKKKKKAVKAKPSKSKKATKAKKSAPPKKPGRKKVVRPVRRGASRGPNEARPTPSLPGSGSAGQSGDIEALSGVEDADSESVEELVEEGQDYEAELVDAVENAPDPDEAEIDTEVPEDDLDSEPGVFQRGTGYNAAIPSRSCSLCRYLLNERADETAKQTSSGHLHLKPLIS